MVPAEGWEGPTGSLRLRTQERTWTFMQPPGVPTLNTANPDQPATTTISATAEQLKLMLWRRVPLSTSLSQAILDRQRPSWHGRTSIDRAKKILGAVIDVRAGR
jgi:hypothetical protein